MDIRAFTPESRSTHTRVNLILASSSPRRADLLREAGYAFTVDPADVDEDRYPGKPLPRELALFLAQSKARHVAQRRAGNVVLAADTVVAFGDTPLGKPHHHIHAREMITLLSGTTHIVVTAIAVAGPDPDVVRVDSAMSAVRMPALTPKRLDDYIASRLWEGKAGGYGIQDPDPIVTLAGGELTNVIGLPMPQTVRLLTQAGIHPAKR
jgi:septum formation protein